jgi:hypothetical protein
MCNLDSYTKGQAAIRELANDARPNGNMPDLSSIFPVSGRPARVGHGTAGGPAIEVPTKDRPVVLSRYQPLTVSYCIDSKGMHMKGMHDIALRLVRPVERL